MASRMYTSRSRCQLKWLLVGIFELRLLPRLRPRDGCLEGGRGTMAWSRCCARPKFPVFPWASWASRYVTTIWRCASSGARRSSFARSSRSPLPSRSRSLAPGA